MTPKIYYKEMTPKIITKKMPPRFLESVQNCQKWSCIPLAAMSSISFAMLVTVRKNHVSRTPLGV